MTPILTLEAIGPKAEQLQAIIIDALAGIDPEWQTHLRVAD